MFLFLLSSRTNRCRLDIKVLRCLLESSEVSREHVSGQVEVFKGIEGDVSVVDHGQHHRDVSTLVGQELDGSQVGDGAVETERPHGGNQSMLSDSRERQLNASVS